MKIKKTIIYETDIDFESLIKQDGPDWFNLDYKPLCIFLGEETREKLMESLMDEIDFLYDHYGFASDHILSSDAKILKHNVLKVIKRTATTEEIK